MQINVKQKSPPAWTPPLSKCSLCWLGGGGTLSSHGLGGGCTSSSLRWLGGGVYSILLTGGGTPFCWWGIPPCPRSGGGVYLRVPPSPDLGWGTPHQQNGVPPWPAMGYPHLDLEWGTPFCLDLGWGTPPQSRLEMGYPPSSVNRLKLLFSFILRMRAVKSGGYFTVVKKFRKRSNLNINKVLTWRIKQDSVSQPTSRPPYSLVGPAVCGRWSFGPLGSRI